MFTFSEFESWLSALSDDTPVGVGCLSGSCPVANWASRRAGRDVLVGVREATIVYEDGEDEEVPLDEGLRLLVQYFDDHFPHAEITAAVARTACSRVREWLENS